MGEAYRKGSEIGGTGILALTMLAGNTTYIPRFSVVSTHGSGDNGVAVLRSLQSCLLPPAALRRKGCVHNLVAARLASCPLTTTSTSDERPLFFPPNLVLFILYDSI